VWTTWKSSRVSNPDKKTQASVLTNKLSRHVVVLVNSIDIELIPLSNTHFISDMSM